MQQQQQQQRSAVAAANLAIAAVDNLLVYAAPGRLGVVSMPFQSRSDKHLARASSLLLAASARAARAGRRAAGRREARGDDIDLLRFVIDILHFSRLLGFVCVTSRQVTANVRL
jgi:hypothetical protein